VEAETFRNRVFEKEETINETKHMVNKQQVDVAELERRIIEKDEKITLLDKKVKETKEEALK
jgi:hypothetical protein